MAWLVDRFAAAGNWAMAIRVAEWVLRGDEAGLAGDPRGYAPLMAQAKAHDHPHPVRPAGQGQQAGQFGDLRAIPDAAVGVMSAVGAMVWLLPARSVVYSEIRMTVPW
jgi:hypothetical protein